METGGRTQSYAEAMSGKRASSPPSASTGLIHTQPAVASYGSTPSPDKSRHASRVSSRTSLRASPSDERAASVQLLSSVGDDADAGVVHESPAHTSLKDASSREVSGQSKATEQTEGYPCCVECVICITTCPCRVACSVCPALCCGCCVERPEGNTVMYDVIRRAIRQGGLTLPRAAVWLTRCFTDLPIPTCCGCCRCMLGVPSGASSVYRRVDPDGKELKLKARWAYPSRGPSPHAFLRDATPDKMAQSRWVLYLHGGGFNVCKTWTYLHVLRALAVRTGAFVVAPRYRRAPEHKHPAALDDCLATYRWLIRRGVPASRIVVFGDSAGGALTALLLSRIADSGSDGDTMPGGAILVSPWVDLADYTSPSWGADRGGGRDFIPERMARKFAANYAGSPLDPTASAINCTVAGFPPVLVESGADEAFCSQVAAYVVKLRAAGVDCRHTETPGAVHVASMFFGTKAAVSTQSWERVISFVEEIWGVREGSTAHQGVDDGGDGAGALLSEDEEIGPSLGVLGGADTMHSVSDV